MIQTHNEGSFQYQQVKINKKKLLRIIIIITSIILIGIIIFLIVKYTKKSDFKLSKELSEVYTPYNLSTFFFFDPITDKPCSEKNYWTIFDSETTCYR